MALVNTAEPHFIRCLKPNKEKVPEKFTSPLAMDQLLSSGVFEAVRIRQSGYASRTLFKDFLGRYKTIVPKAMQAEIMKAKTPEAELATTKVFIEQMPKVLEPVGGLAENGLALGKSKVFCKAGATNALERARDLALVNVAVTIQRFFRGYRVRRKLGSVRITFGKLNQWCNDNKFYTTSGSQHTALAKYKTKAKIEASIKEATVLIAEVSDLPMGYPRINHVNKVKTRMETEVNMLGQLESLAKSLEPVEIEAALKRAKGLELEGAGEAVDSLAMRVKKLKVQVPLVTAMKNAIEQSNLSMLQEVMEKVKKEGFATRPEDWIEELKGEAIAGDVYNLIEDLKSKKRLDDIEKKRKEELQHNLEAQMEQQQAKFVEVEEVKPKEPEPEEAPRKRKATITGFTEDQQEKVKIGLLGATHEFDAEALEHGLAEAAAQGMDESDMLKKAQELFQNMQTEAFLAATLEKMSTKVHEKEETIHAVRCIKNICNQADKLGVATEAVATARKGMQEEVRHRARKTIRGDMFFQGDMSELDLVEDAFSDLSKYPGLKPADKWRGHRTFMLLRTETEIACRLKHSKKELFDALTQVPPALERKAVDIFRGLLGWMSDRPMPDCQRLGYGQDIVDAAKSDPALADETYVQVMKQLTDNPSKRSVLEGWKLMLSLCQHVSPSTQLDDFLHTYLLQASRDATTHEEIGMIARQCIADLNIITSEETVMEDAEELTPVQVFLIDHTSRKLHIPKGTTLEQLAERMSQQLRIDNSKDFCLFQMTEGLEMHRLLPGSVGVTTLFEKWAALKTASGRSTRLLYKRRFLQVTESLLPGDLMHATLTFRQAVWDFLHYPIPEDVPFVIEIAVNLMILEYDHFSTFVEEGTLPKEGILEQLVPEVCLRHERNRSQWAAQVVQRFYAIWDNYKDESRLVKMSRIFTLLQRMKLFGVYYWMGRQQMSVPKECVAIQDAPEQMVKINKKAPEAEYWICVDLFGVRFVSADCTPGKGFQRGFQYSDEAVERLLCWGAKNEFVQLVVLAAPEAAAGGSELGSRAPMSLALKSPAAMDISFAIHTVLSHLGTLPQSSQ
mmetsp:Transcript_40494/g.109446  ORF Transcript_40494/g.109446 Transcript_40494/m.109446 type:complete len:1073 (-) Transcript_40494:203-3421(-)